MYPLTKLTYDGDGCTDHAISLLQSISSHSNKRVRNGGGEQHCIDSDDLQGELEETNTSHQLGAEK